MARKPHLKTSFDPEILEGLVERAKQAKMKSPQDYVRYLVQRDDENMGVHVAFEERDEFRRECGVLSVSRGHWKKEFEHQKKERDQAVKEHAGDLRHLGELLECAGFIGRITTEIQDLKGYKERFEIVSNSIEVVRDERESARKDRDTFKQEIETARSDVADHIEHYRVVVNEFTEAFGVKEGESIKDAKNRQNEGIANTVRELNKYKSRFETLSGAVELIKKERDNLLLEIRNLAVFYGCPANGNAILYSSESLTKEHDDALEASKELETDLKQWQSIGIALGVGPTYEKANQRIADLAFEPIYMVIWRRVRQFFAGLKELYKEDKD